VSQAGYGPELDSSHIRSKRKSVSQLLSYKRDSHSTRDASRVVNWQVLMGWPLGPSGVERNFGWDKLEACGTCWNCSNMTKLCNIFDRKKRRGKRHPLFPHLNTKRARVYENQLILWQFACIFRNKGRPGPHPPACSNGGHRADNIITWLTPERLPSIRWNKFARLETCSRSFPSCVEDFVMVDELTLALASFARALAICAKKFLY